MLGHAVGMHYVRVKIHDPVSVTSVVPARTHFSKKSDVGRCGKRENQIWSGAAKHQGLSEGEVKGCIIRQLADKTLPAKSCRGETNDLHAIAIFMLWERLFTVIGTPRTKDFYLMPAFCKDLREAVQILTRRSGVGRVKLVEEEDVHLKPETGKLKYWVLDYGSASFSTLMSFCNSVIIAFFASSGS